MVFLEVVVGAMSTAGGRRRLLGYSSAVALLNVFPMSLGPMKGPGFEIHCGAYALGCLVAYALAHDGGALGKRLNVHHLTPRYYEDAFPAVVETTEPSVFLFSSYVWNHASNLIVADRVKRHSPESLVIFGGPQIPRGKTTAPAFLDQNPNVDLIVRGEGEITLAEILQAVVDGRSSAARLLDVDLTRIPGVISQRGSREVDPIDRSRLRDLSILPSPYGTGLFDHWIDGTHHMSLETNRGCPYGCTFCDWGAATLSKIASMSLERVFADIEYAGLHRIASLGICDANFGILKRDVQIAQRIVDVHQRTGYPKVVTYSVAKVMKPELLEIVKLLHGAGLITFGQASMQTTDERVLSIIQRSNIKTSEYDTLLAFYRSQEIPSFTEFMLVLPGQTLDTCARDLQFVFDRKIHARLAATSVLPNAPMADPEYRATYKIELDPEGYVKSCFSFTPAEGEKILHLGFAYKLLASIGSGIAKYILYFMQIERGVLALDFIRTWLRVVPENPDLYPRSHALWTQVVSAKKSGSDKGYMLLAWGTEQGEALLRNPTELCREVLDLAQRELGVSVSGNDVESLVTAQAALIPQNNPAAPTSIALPHDVMGYFAEIRRIANVREIPPGFKPLREWGPSALVLEEPFRSSLEFMDMAAPARKLELRANLSL
jgi:radical SAM superfamily enzyme YgiQ (UPF0313 family)